MENYVSIIKPGMRIGFIDADLIDGGTRHPNLALMKIAGFCKETGCQYELLENYESIKKYDLVFMSSVFSFTTIPIDPRDFDNLIVGGTGFFEDGGDPLPDVIEHHMPDYDLYKNYVNKKICEGRSRAWYADYLDYSIGFTTRGCFRKCSFCVNKKYDRAFAHSPIQEFLDPNRRYIYLWDDNFLAYPGWKNILDELEATGKPYQFRQGLDIRLMNDEKAEVLSQAHYIGDFIFAFDHLEQRDRIEKNLKIWRKHTVRGTRLYVLCAYDSQDERDIESVFARIEILMGYGCLPYLMRYEDYKKSKWRRLYINLARWCNQPQFFKKLSFRQFCEKNQTYHKNPNTKCSALASMEEFEKEHPTIAAAYFDLRFEEKNMYRKMGRLFTSEPSTNIETLLEKTWRSWASGGLNRKQILVHYYNKEIDIVWAAKREVPDLEKKVLELFEVISTSTLDEIIECLASTQYEEPITPDNIPQFSSINDICHSADRLVKLDSFLSYKDLGIYLSGGKKKSDLANKKFGENHGKAATLLDLANLERRDKILGFTQTPFSKIFCTLPKNQRRLMLARLSLRIPIIRKLLVDAIDTDVHMADYMITLSASTKTRRRSNVSSLVDFIYDASTESDMLIKTAISRIDRTV